MSGSVEDGAAATTPVTTAVMITPGMTSSPSPTATRSSTRAESWRPPWKRMNETPRVSSSWAPMESSGTSIASSDRRARASAPAASRTQHAGQAEDVGDQLGDEAGAEHERERQDDVLDASTVRDSDPRRPTTLATLRAHATSPRLMAACSSFSCSGRAADPALSSRSRVALYLTVVELRELRPHWKWWIWWLLARLPHPLRRLPRPACLCCLPPLAAQTLAGLETGRSGGC